MMVPRHVLALGMPALVVSMALIATAHADPLSDAFALGKALGSAGNTAGHGQVTAGTARTTVPNYSATPPQTSYFTSPGLSFTANA